MRYSLIFQKNGIGGGTEKCWVLRGLSISRANRMLNSNVEVIVRVYPLSDIYAGEEWLVKYSSRFFGPNNEDCYCAPCISKRFAPLEVAANETVSPLNHPAFPNFQSNAVFHELQYVAPLDNVVFNDLHSASSLGQPVFHEIQSVAPFDNPVLQSFSSIASLDNQVIHEFQSSCDWNTATLGYPLATPSETAETTSLNSTPTGCPSSTVAQPVAPAAQLQKPAEMKKKQKKAKYSDNNDCIVCHHSVKRVDRYLLTVHGDFLIALDMQLIKDVLRFPGMQWKCVDVLHMQTSIHFKVYP